MAREAAARYACFIWLFENPSRISMRADAAINSSATQVFVSSVTAFEIATKLRIGKLVFDPTLLPQFDDRLRDLRFEPLVVTSAHSVAAGMLIGAHKDPFDRLLAGQAQLEGMSIATADKAMASLGATVIG